MDLDMLKTLGGGGIAAALLGLIYLVGMKLVAAIDRIGNKLDEHTKSDVEHHGDVKEAIVRVEAKLDARSASGPYRSSLAVVRSGEDS